MSAWPPVPPADVGLSRAAAIVGLGETDYHDDYRRSRQQQPDFCSPTITSLTKTAFERALADSGLNIQDIDGLSVSYLHGGPDPRETAQMLGLKPKYAIENAGIMAGPLPVVCAAIAAGKANTVAMVYAVTPRAVGRAFGGQNISEGYAVPPSYYYYHPWGWSSQVAHWALVWSYYQRLYGKCEADLGAVAMQLRRNAIAHPQAIMREPLSLEDYLASRYVVRPLHLLDICLVNDGAVCLIVRRSDMANDLPHAPVLIAGWGESLVKTDKLDTLVRKRLQPQFRDAGQQALGMAGLALSDVGHFEAYDAASMHLVSHVEGHGFAQAGEGLDLFQSGQAANTGRIPINVGGGMLSGSYMHGWSHIAEVTRQLRHEAHGRQIPGLHVSMFSLAQTDSVHPLLLTRGGPA